MVSLIVSQVELIIEYVLDNLVDVILPKLYVLLRVSVCVGLRVTMFVIENIKFQYVSDLLNQLVRELQEKVMTVKPCIQFVI